MKILKKIIIIIILVILIFTIVIQILLRKNKKQSDDEYSIEINDADKTEINKELKEVTIADSYYTVVDCMENYINAVSMKIDGTQEDYIEGRRN